MLTIKNLTKSYGKLLALDHVSAEFGNGIYGILGPNGAGKSTLLQLITMSLYADEGEILWNNTAIASLGAQYRAILGYMPQQQGLYDGFSGFAFLNYIAVLKNISRKNIRQEIARVAALTNMTDRLRDRLSGYSGGMKQRILLAAAILGDPKLVILDEPTAGLDPKERIRTRELVQSLAESKTVLVATHVVSDIETIAHEVVLLQRGRILAKNTPTALCTQYASGKGLEDVYLHCFAKEDAG